MTWQFLDTGFRPGAQNMAVDEELAISLVSGGSVATVRVYGWTPPAISLGWNQSLDEIDLERAQEAGVDVVRRPTGGRAILHSDELTYSVTMVAERSNILEVYHRISTALVRGLEYLGVSARLEKSQPHFPSVYRETSGIACFTSSARHEIKIAGRKLVGSAQRRYARPDGREAVLQHGSILLGPDHRRLVDFLRLPDVRAARMLRTQLETHTTDLSAELGRRVAPHEVAATLKRGFEEAWGIAFTSDAVAVREDAAVNDTAKALAQDTHHEHFQPH